MGLPPQDLLVNLCQYWGIFKVTAHWKWQLCHDIWGGVTNKTQWMYTAVSWNSKFQSWLFFIQQYMNRGLHWLKLCHHNLVGSTTADKVVLLKKKKKKSIKLQFICLFIFIFCTWKNFVSVLEKSWNLIIFKCVGTNRTLVLPSAHPPVFGRARP